MTRYVSIKNVLILTMHKPDTLTIFSQSFLIKKYCYITINQVLPLILNIPWQGVVRDRGLASKDNIQKTRKELERPELRKSNLQNDLTDRTISPKGLPICRGGPEKQLVDIKVKPTDLQQEISPFNVYAQKEILIMENLMELCRKSDRKINK